MNVLVAAPHPDDETLGCGGTILKHKAEGHKVYWLIMTNVSVKGGHDKRRVAERQREIEKVAIAYGIDNIFKLDYPTAMLDTLPRAELVEAVSNVIQKTKPNTIYVPNRNDVHSDHRITFDVAVSASKPFRCPFIRKLLAYEVVSETDLAPPLRDHVFTPNSFSDISGYLDRKLSIMEIYKTEISGHPFPRSLENIKALATIRGASVYVRYAEAFCGLREIW